MLIQNADLPRYLFGCDRRSDRSAVRVPNHQKCLHAKRTFAAIIEAMGGTVQDEPAKDFVAEKAIAQPGFIIHEVGGTLPGSDPKKSVVNAFNQSHDVKNLFLTDGAPFASNADKNPTLTIMALAWRACDYLVDEARKGNL